MRREVPPAISLAPPLAASRKGVRKKRMSITHAGASLLTFPMGSPHALAPNPSTCSQTNIAAGLLVWAHSNASPSVKY